MMTRYCRSYIAIALIFIALSVISDDNMFYVFYPCIICGIIPVNLLAYDERSRWIGYSCSLPCSRTQIVSAKYLMGLMSQLAMIFAIGAVQGIKMSVKGTFSLEEFSVLLLAVLLISIISSSVSLPFIFKLGVEKGRIAYYVMIGLVCALSVIASNVFKGNVQISVPSGALQVVLALASVGIYALSWFLSVVFYSKREIQ